MQATTIIKEVKKIEIKTKKLVDGLIAGNYHSIFKGNGIEFSDIREYEPGDDIRAIDWKVTARFNKPYIKEFIEERDLRVYIIFDVSGSSDFGTSISKREKSIILAATLMFAGLRNNDKIGTILFSEDIEKQVPARKGKKHVLKQISILLTYNPKTKKTNISKSLKSISKVIKKRSIIFIISDFMTNDNYLPTLKILSKKHDVVAIKITDPRELELPDVGLVEVEDEETGEQLLINTSDENFRRNYQKIMLNEEKKIIQNMKKAKVRAITVRTDQQLHIPLKKFFKKSAKRLK